MCTNETSEYSQGNRYTTFTPGGILMCTNQNSEQSQGNHYTTFTSGGTMYSNVYQPDLWTFIG